MSYEVLALQCRLPIEVVQAYAALFFDVEGRRDCVDWIKNRVIGLFDSQYGHHLGVAWKWLGYVGGPEILDLVVQSSLPVDGCSPIKFARAWSMHSLLKARLCVGYLTLPRTAEGALNRVLRRIWRLENRHSCKRTPCEMWFTGAYKPDLSKLCTRILSLDRKIRRDGLEGEVLEIENVGEEMGKRESCQCASTLDVHQSKE